jgi:hypothetical protein
MSGGDTKASPEIKKLIEKLAPPPTAETTAQGKYEAILQRKCYDHHCLLECVLLRLDSGRGNVEQSNVQTRADQTFTHMLTHALW